MKYTKLHMTVRIILLCAVILFSTGFTTVVKYCSMSQSDECCCESDHSDKAAAQSSEPAVSDQNSSCLTVKVIGGLNEIKAIVAPESLVKMTVMDAVLFDPDVLSLQTPAHSLLLTYTDDVAPPNGDICIRISSLLI